jgi:hypothetical protein
MEENDKVMLKGDGDSFNCASSQAFSTTMPFNAEGNIMSLLYNDDFELTNTLDEPSTFSYLFANTSIVSAKNLILSPTILASNCYEFMFFNCTSLIDAPKVLPATTLANFCYHVMFCGCTSLTSAPELLATTLAPYCRSQMFNNCYQLKESPVLIAPKLENGCYEFMFKGCTSLNKITMLAIDIKATDCLFDWVNGVASSGTFIKHEFMTSLENSSNGIPEGWTDANSTVNYFYVFNVRDVSQNLHTFYCENGMRWVDYIHSKYNVYGFKIENDKVFYSMGILMNSSSSIYVRPDELIVSGVTYNQIPN